MSEICPATSLLDDVRRLLWISRVIRIRTEVTRGWLDWVWFASLWTTWSQADQVAFLQLRSSHRRLRRQLDANESRLMHIFEEFSQ